MAEARIDKWMWAVRIFKTRTIAAEACKKGRITINGSLVKAARMIKPGDVIQVKKPPIISKVLAICNTQGASIPRESDAVLYTHAGPEVAVASTKAFVAQIIHMTRSRRPA